MSNFLCVEAYFAVLKWRFFHKIIFLSRTARTVRKFLSNHRKLGSTSTDFLCFSQTQLKAYSKLSSRYYHNEER